MRVFVRDILSASEEFVETTTARAFNLGKWLFELTNKRNTSNKQTLWDAVCTIIIDDCFLFCFFFLVIGLLKNALIYDIHLLRLLNVGVKCANIKVKSNWFYLDDEGSRTGCCCLSVGGSKICSRSSLESSNSANWSISAMFNERLFIFVSDLW